MYTRHKFTNFFVIQKHRGVSQMSYLKSACCYLAITCRMWMSSLEYERYYKMEDEDSYSRDDGDISEEEMLHALKEKGLSVDLCVTLQV